LGVILLLPAPTHWCWKYMASVLEFFGAVVAVNQNFIGWLKISKEQFACNELLYVEPSCFQAGGC